MLHISKNEASKYLLRYQELHTPRQLVSDSEIVQFIRRIGCIQYDPLSPAARNADLVLQSRCRNYSEATLYRLLYEKRELLDWWDKNMSIFAVSDWPHFARKRDGYEHRYESRAGELEPAKREIIRQIEEKGCVSSKDVFGNQKVQWSWAPTDIGRATLESMYHRGDLMIHHKEGTRKHYGLTDRLLPESLVKKPDPHSSVDDYHDWYVLRRIASIGLLWNKSGDAWLGTGLKKDERTRSIKRLLDNGKITEVRVDQSDHIFYLPSVNAELLNEPVSCDEASIIAPLDNLIWDRDLVSTIFNFDYKWEVYTPAGQRKFGYYVLPVIFNDRFIGRCEPVVDRQKRELTIRNFWWEANVQCKQAMTEALIRCFSAFAAFLDVDTITPAGNVSPRGLEWLGACNPN